MWGKQLTDYDQFQMQLLADLLHPPSVTLFAWIHLLLLDLYQARWEHAILGHVCACGPPRRCHSISRCIASAHFWSMGPDVPRTPRWRPCRVGAVMYEQRLVSKHMHLFMRCNLILQSISPIAAYASLGAGMLHWMALNMEYTLPIP